ncbi:MAG: Acetylornithine/succinyldiaminopimelate aminotransferase [Gemmatimonadaceae bacterium]|nr:Acetylornithine/succinyldiaminopimelate aminotransferase [Gemmatimonadaceae bacterium]
MLTTAFPVPPFAPADAARLLTRWGLTGTAVPLPGERDRSFVVREAGGRQFVLKVSHNLEERAILDLQNAALACVARHGSSVDVPRVVRSESGADIEVVTDRDGTAYFARLLTWVPGTPLVRTRPLSDDLMVSLGAALGRVNAALASFDHLAARRVLKWDLVQSAWATPFVANLADEQRRALVAAILDGFTSDMAPRLRATRSTIIHGDANDYNILTRPVDDDLLSPRVVGLIDFGDVVESHPVCDLAIAIAYAMLDRPDPIATAASIARGFHAEYPLTEDEVAMLIPLARTRLAVSVVNAALQLDIAPDHEYLQVTAAPAWRLLDVLVDVSDDYAQAVLRGACGFEPCRKSTAVREWLVRNRQSFQPIAPIALDGPDVQMLDLSVGSTELGPDDEWQEPARLSSAIFSRLRDRGAVAAVGRYDEVRALYTSDVFQTNGNDGPEYRAIHLGVDVFMPAGTAVYAPLAGRIHSLRDNAKSLDYGPTVILEHAVAPSLTFHTLYGHLSRASLCSLAVGDAVPAGGRLGEIGELTENGGWPPHLHFQIVCDLFGNVGDFPGVARDRERDVWLSASPDPSLILPLPAGARAARSEPVERLLERRRAHVGRALSVAYRRPLHIVRGTGQFLIDAGGRRYLDAVNNVAHVGHSHPRVVRAGQRQMQVLNTNTRYLHDDLLSYADELTSTFPDPLRIVYFVCSGSEANELAIRLARAHTGERDMVVIDAGYHGNTSTLIDVSSYKFDGPGGRGAPEWVRKVPMPDDYRGPFKRDDPEAGWKYAQAVREAVASIRREGRRPAAFLAESVLSCGGQIVLPPGYLAEAYRHVRDAGGVCIADEVQVGFGRVGSHFWAFETQGVVPDIVTMGKPIGNGHPLAAVVTTPEIANSFANGMEFFSTFGGNPVSCAIGRAVLAVIREEELQHNADAVGQHLTQRLLDVKSRHSLVGDVRGPGLFVGVEFVDDRTSLAPATRQASYVANRMKEMGILMSTDGPFNNVLKIKPPLCFTSDDADCLVDAMDRALLELEVTFGA